MAQYTGNKGTRRGNGAGWGGPAKGAGSGAGKQDFDVRTNVQGHHRSTDPSLSRAERRRVRADELEDHLHLLAFTAAEQRDQINAATRLHAICDGTPVARQEIRLNVDPSKMTDEELLEIAKGVPALTD